MTTVANHDLYARGARSLVAITVVLCAVFPTVLQSLKMILLALALAAIFILILRQQLVIPGSWRTFAFISLFFTCIGILWSAYGTLRGNPGAIAMASVYVIYPCLLVILCLLSRPGDIKKIRNLLLLTTCAVLLVELVFVASAMGADGGLFFGWIQALRLDAAVVDIEDSYLAFALPNVNSLMFLAPFLMVGAMFDEKRTLAPTVLTGLSVAALLIAGRRVAYPAIGVAIVVAFVAGRAIIQNHAIKGRVVTRVVGIALLLVLITGAFVAAGLLDVEVLAGSVASIFDFTSDDSNFERKLQFNALIDQINIRPLVGMGSGAVASYIRSSDQPWAYELSYVALVFQFGLLGLLAYVGGVAYLGVRIWRTLKFGALSVDDRITLLSLLSALAAFLVANATNPYLAKFDFMWVLFLPVAAVIAAADSETAAKA